MGFMGTSALTQTVGPLQRVSADGYPQWLPIGMTIAWDKVTAESADTTLADGTKVFAGEKAILRGTVMVPITKGEVVTVVRSSGADAWTGGTADWTLTKVDEYGVTQTSVETLDYDASAAEVQAALEAFYGTGRVTVAFDTETWTITFHRSLGNVTAITVDVTDITSGGTAAATVTTTTAGDADGGKWAPADTSASDGRQTLARDAVTILDVTIKQASINVLGGYEDTKLVGGIIGGLVWEERLVVGGTNQVTLDNLKTAMPLLRTIKGDG